MLVHAITGKNTSAVDICVKHPLSETDLLNTMHEFTLFMLPAVIQYEVSMFVPWQSNDLWDIGVVVHVGHVLKQLLGPWHGLALEPRSE